MKLIDLLVKELPKSAGWPSEAVTAIYFSHKKGVTFYDKDEMVIKNGVSFICIDIGGVRREEVTKEEFEAAIAKNDGWIQWAGGDCPVDSDAIVEVRYRKTNTYQYNNDRAGDFDWAHAGSSSDIIAYRLHDQGINHRANDDRLEQDLNECIGQGVDVPEWNGEGLPPVGTVCMANLANGWTDVKVAYIGDEGGCHEALVFEVKTTKPAWADEFRPLRTEVEKEREAVCHEIASMIGRGTFFEDAERIYDAIAEGKIPGVKLEGK